MKREKNYFCFCSEYFKAAIESLLSGAICGCLYHLFAGQPLTILGSTGPVLVFESIVFHFCKYEISNFFYRN